MPHANLCGEFLFIPHVVLCGEFLLHALCYFMWGVSLTHFVLCYVGSFSYTPHAMLCGEFLLQTPCCFKWGVFLTWPLLCYVGSFSYNDPTVFMLFYVGGFSYTLHASPLTFYQVRHNWSGFALSTDIWQTEAQSRHDLCSCTINDFCFALWEFLLHSLCCFMWGVSLTLPVLFYVGSFSYTPCAVLCGEFLLHFLCCFLWEFVLHVPCYFRHVGNFS